MPYQNLRARGDLGIINPRGVLKEVGSFALEVIAREPFVYVQYCVCSMGCELALVLFFNVVLKVADRAVVLGGGWGD